MRQDHACFYIIYVDTRISTSQELVQEKTMLDVIDDDYNMKQATELKELYRKHYNKI